MMRQWVAELGTARFVVASLALFATAFALLCGTLFRHRKDFRPLAEFALDPRDRVNSNDAVMSNSSEHDGSDGHSRCQNREAVGP